MVVGLLASKATLHFKVINNLLYSVTRLIKQDSNEYSDLPWIYMTMMAIITIVQVRKCGNIILFYYLHLLCGQKNNYQ